MTTAEGLKLAAAEEALGRVRSGMRLGLGTGSTVAHFLTLLGERLKGGALHDVVGVATSVRTADRAHVLGIPIGSLHEHLPLDLTVDGADEVDPALDLIKGLGGALLREKIVAQASRSLIVIVDEAKEVARLGQKAPLPVEVVSYAWQVQEAFLASLGCEPKLRPSVDAATPLSTDNGNYILDCHFPGGLPEPHELDAHLRSRAGIVETGLFLGLATEVIVAGSDGVRVRRREERPGR